ncbi:hypothetical protein GCM10022377_19460 [Zhihengliuella alba]|uniref:Uncharacterized protein n=1 Tax=Zhihengliuella alba TaxID=547018 RepID=A0ABP7DNI4_9MICC
MYVVTINQRDTRAAGDRVDDLVRALGDLPTAFAFRRSVADETIGILTDPAAVVAAALVALRERRWNVGIGVGSLHEPLPEALDDVRGSAIVHARRAVTAAQRTGERVPLVVSGPEADLAAEAEAVLRLLGHIVARRTAAEWAVVDLLVPGVRGQHKEIGVALGITSQAVSKAVLRAQAKEEWAARPAAARLLGLLHAS